MKIKITIAIFILCWLIFFQLLSQKNNFTQSYPQLYKKAEALFNEAATDSTDSVALILYTKIINTVKPDTSNVVTLYNCYERTGILKQGLGYTSNKYSA